MRFWTMRVLCCPVHIDQAPPMRREIGYWHREGRELFYYLEFKPDTAEFYLTCEHTPAEGVGSVRSVLLSEARGERYYEDALLIIKEELFKQCIV